MVAKTAVYSLSTGEHESKVDLNNLVRSLGGVFGLARRATRATRAHGVAALLDCNNHKIVLCVSVCAGLGASCTGCTDPLACNYFPDAIFDDGSCSFPPPGYPCDCITDIAHVAELDASASSANATTATGTAVGGVGGRHRDAVTTAHQGRSKSIS